MSKPNLYELAIDNGDGNPITNFRIAYNIEDLTEDILPLRLSHPNHKINVWELKKSLKRKTDKYIHVFNQAAVDFENGQLKLPRPQMPSGFPLEINGIPGFVELSDIGCSCGQCGIDDQLELGFEEF